MIRAIIFDFNGVIADDETPHLHCFQQALAESGLSLTKEEYYGTYLGMDERTCATALLAVRDHTCDRDVLSAIMERKATLFREYTARHKPPLFSGVVEFVKQATTQYRLAIATGGRREQIDHALHDTAIEQDFPVLVSADDCAVGKPDPAIYRHTLKLLNAQEPRPTLITAGECLVVEDSLAGIQSAKAAGMAVLALATTYPAEKLREADYILPNLEGITLEEVLRLISANRPPTTLHPNSSR
ncbi:MAG: HAD family phosphatase [Nitrospirota bacterium]|nr:HAD family phosphatase [Nitrospirota bacterium]